MMPIRRMLACALLLLLGAGDATAQRRQISLEATPVHGAIGYGWVASGRVTGIELGFGFPQVDRTLTPSDHDLLDIIHIGVFMRSPPARPITADGRLAVGLGELDGCSGCFPGAVLSASGGAFWGTRHVKIGPRVTTGWITEHGGTDSASGFFLYLRPVAVLFNYAW
jgi:hypothetical protein